jgi:hypothetical protein
MSHHFDEFSKSLAETSVPRRESFRLLGAAVAGALLGPFGMRSALGGGPDPCKSFCNQCPKAQRDQCLAACRACNNDPKILCGHCGGFACCGSDETCCGDTCHNLASDFEHCGGCFSDCGEPGPYEYGACISGRCEYRCVEGAANCAGICTNLLADPNNCGACGHVCSGSTPNCGSGACDHCPRGYADCYGNGGCINLSFDLGNCGACGVECDRDFETCSAGRCVPTEPPPLGNW